MAIIDREGNEWELQDAVIRILVEKYPDYLNEKEIALVLNTHPKFVFKVLDTFFRGNILLKRDGTYKIKRSFEGTYKVGEILVKSHEAILDEGIHYFKALELRDLFIEKHKSRYLNFPEI